MQQWDNFLYYWIYFFFFKMMLRSRLSYFEFVGLLLCPKSAAGFVIRKICSSNLVSLTVVFYAPCINRWNLLYLFSNLVSTYHYSTWKTYIPCFDIELDYIAYEDALGLGWSFITIWIELHCSLHNQSLFTWLLL